MNKLLNMIQIKPHVDGQLLKQRSYRLDIKRGGYVSSSGATIVYLYRKPYYGEVLRVEGSGTFYDYLRDLEHLRLKGLVEGE